MDPFWGCISNIGSVTTIITALKDAVSGTVNKEKFHKLETLDIGIDFSTLSADLEPHMEIVNRYITQKRNCVVGLQLFPPVEKEQFVTDLLAQEPALRQYKCEVESVLYRFLDTLEQLLISQMSPGEQFLTYKMDESKEILRSLLAEVKKDNGQLEIIQLMERDIYSANDLYAQSFHESLFLHKGSDKVNLINLFVLQKYIEGRSFSINPQNDLADRLARFMQQEKRAFLFIEGDAGSGKSSLVSWINYHVSHQDAIADKLLGHRSYRKLLTIRLRDLQKDIIAQKQSLMPAILDYMHIPTIDAWERIYPEAIMILDGFDELCLINQIANYEELLYDLWRKSPAKHNVIVTTRPKYISLGKIDIPHQFITLQHFDAENRAEWLMRYTDQNFCGQPIDIKIKEYIENITIENASGVCDTPMTIYMLAAQKFEANSILNIWMLYHQIFYKELSETEYNQMFPNSNREYTHEIIKLRDIIYRITEEIAYKMYCDQNGELYLSSTKLSKIIESLSEQEPLLKTVQQRKIAMRCYALCNYWKAQSDEGLVEFYHNNIRDFFICEKVFREVDIAYKNWRENPQSGICNAVESMYRLFSYSEFSTEVCQFIFQRASYQATQSTNDFLKHFTQFLPKLFVGILMTTQVQESQSASEVLRKASNTLTCITQFYRCYYDPYLRENDRIKWWDSVAQVNSDGLLKYLFTSVFSCGPGKDKSESIPAASSRADFSSLNLESLNLKNSKFEFSNFAYANLKDAILSNCDCRSSCFDCAALSNVIAKKAMFAGAKMHNCHLIGADLEGADFSGAELVQRAKLQYANLAKCVLRETDFTGATLINANMTQADVTAANFINAVLADADLSGIFGLGRIKFRNAKMNNCVLSEANLFGADFSRANLTQTSLMGATLVSTDFKGANLTGVDLTGADLAGSDLSNLDLTHIVIDSTSIQRTKFINAKMIGCNLSGVNLKSVDFREANLTDADLTNADLCGAILPDGFCSTNQEEQVKHLKQLNISGLRI